MESERHIPAAAYFERVLRAADEVLISSRSYREWQEKSLADPNNIKLAEQAKLQRGWLITAEQMLDEYLSGSKR
jgi:hypothetical protein